MYKQSLNKDLIDPNGPYNYYFNNGKTDTLNKFAKFKA